MRNFQSHKIVKAEQILAYEVITTPTKDYVRFTLADGAYKIGTIDTVFRYQPKKGDYLVEYDNQYLSVSPKHVFESGYSEVHPVC